MKQRSSTKGSTTQAGLAQATTTDPQASAQNLQSKMFPPLKAVPNTATAAPQEDVRPKTASGNRSGKI